MFTSQHDNGNHNTIGNTTICNHVLNMEIGFYTCISNLNFEPVSGVKWLVVSLLFCFCSVLSKEQGITAVAVCFTYDVFIAQKVTVMYLQVWVEC